MGGGTEGNKEKEVGDTGRGGVEKRAEEDPTTCNSRFLGK
jgi:hypothetical protein